MKNFKILFFTLLLICLLTNCVREKQEFQPVNNLQKFSQVESQVFELDTVSWQLVKGRLGTEIYFVRDIFKVDENQKITLELKEFYEGKELLYNNISTITNKNELLESSGVIFLDIKTDGEKVSLKENERLQIKFPDNRLSGNDIFYANPDSLNQFKWIKEEDLYVGVMNYDQLYKIDMLKPVRMDSLDFYRKEPDDTIQENTSGPLIIPPILIDKFGWINIDKIIDPDGIVNFELIVKNDNIYNFSTHIIYKELNSFISEYRTIDSLKFKNIPIKNQTQLIIVGKQGEQMFAEKIEIKNIPEQKINVRLKKIDSIELKNIVDE